MRSYCGGTRPETLSGTACNCYGGTAAQPLVGRMEADTICRVEKPAHLAAIAINRQRSQFWVQKPMLYAVFSELSGHSPVYREVGWLSHSMSGAHLYGN